MADVIEVYTIEEKSEPLRFNTDGIKKRLESLGYEVKEDDKIALTFCIEKVRSTIKNEVNWQDVPKGLEHIAVDMAVGEFLHGLLQTGQLSDAFDIDTAIKQVSEGDTTVAFAIGDGSSSVEQRLNLLIDYLIKGRRDEFSCFRKLRW